MSYKYHPVCHTPEGVVNICKTVSVQTSAGWVPARPIGSPTLMQRIRYAVMVFRGQADILVWPAKQ